MKGSITFQGRQESTDARTQFTRSCHSPCCISQFFSAQVFSPRFPSHTPLVGFLQEDDNNIIYIVSLNQGQSLDVHSVLLVAMFQMVCETVTFTITYKMLCVTKSYRGLPWICKALTQQGDSVSHLGIRNTEAQKDGVISVRVHSYLVTWSWFLSQLVFLFAKKSVSRILWGLRILSSFSWKIYKLHN